MEWAETIARQESTPKYWKILENAIKINKKSGRVHFG